MKTTLARMDHPGFLPVARLRKCGDSDPLTSKTTIHEVPTRFCVFPVFLCALRGERFRFFRVYSHERRRPRSPRFTHSNAVPPF